jgi:hypothetical protein
MCLGSKARLVHQTDNFSALCKPIVYKMRDLQCLLTLQAYTSCYGEGATFTLTYILQWLLYIPSALSIKTSYFTNTV